MSDVDYSAPFDASDFILREQKSAKITALDSLDDDPEKAARAQQLADATGEHPALVYGDLKNFETQHKAALTNELLSNNQFLQSYVNSHPLAAKISNDDYGQLDAVSGAVKNFVDSDFVKNTSEVAKGAYKSLIEGPKQFKQIEQDTLAYLLKQGMDPAQAKIQAAQAGKSAYRGEALTNALFAIPTIALSPAIGAFQTYVSKPIEKTTGFPAEAIDILTMSALAALGLRGARSGAFAEAPKSTTADVINFLKDVDKYAADTQAGPPGHQPLAPLIPYIEAGKTPPVGTHPLVDDIHKAQAKTDADALTEALKESVKSATRERSPDFFTSYADRPADGGQIGISADAVRKLYGDKVPVPGDGPLGFVPDLAAQLARAEATGGDIQVGVAKYLGHVDPEVHKELVDSIRARPEGVTVEEGKELPTPEGTTAEPVGTIRQAAGLQGQIPKPSLSLKRSGPESDGFHTFDVMGKDGEQKATLDLRESGNKKTINIEMLTAREGVGAIGQKGLVTIAEEIAREFPTAEKIDYHHISGAKGEKPVSEIGETSIDLGPIRERMAAREAAAPKEGEAPGLLQRVKEAVVGKKPKTPEQLELDLKAIEERDLFDKASAIGMTVDQYKRYAKLINERAAEDAEAASKRALADQAKRQTKEWKANRAELRPQVREEVLARPEIELDEMLREGKVKLAADALTPDQRALLPKDFVAADGIHPEDLANLFGDRNAAALVDRVIALGQGREAAGMKPKPHLERLVDAETDRQMEAKYGSLGKNILDEAKDQVLSETQESLLHEEVLARAEEAGMQLTITKDELKAAIKDFFDRSAVKDVSSDKGLAEAGRAGRAAEMALLKGDYAEAFRQKQRQFNAFTMATFAKKFEKVQAEFEEAAKRFSAREPNGVSPEYTNWIHDILGRTNNPVKRSVQDLQGAIAHSEHSTLADFVQYKTNHDLREIPVAEYLLDPSFTKDTKDLTTKEFTQLNNSIKTLAKNGSEENKIEMNGQKIDEAEAIDRLAATMNRFERKQYDLETGQRKQLMPKTRKMLRSFGVAHLQIETLLDNLDRYNNNGDWNQMLFRPLVEGVNGGDVLVRKVAQQLGAIADKVDLKERIPNHLFYDPWSTIDGGELSAPSTITRKALRVVLLNMGNESNFNKLAAGYFQPTVKLLQLGLDPKKTAMVADALGKEFRTEQFTQFKRQIQDWVNTHATKEDWDWSQKVWDVLEELHQASDTMYRSVSGVAPEALVIKPIDTPHGQYKGGYYPLIRHPLYGEDPKFAKDFLEGQGYVKATTAAGYTNARTGAIYPLSLNLDQLPNQINQIIHDISLRPAVIQASKIVYNKKLMNVMKAKLGEEYAGMLQPWLKDIVNTQNYSSNKVMAELEKFSNFIMQNAGTTLIGLNPTTVMKHTPTAFSSSLAEVGAKTFQRGARALLTVNEETGQNNYQFMKSTSEEMQRRDRNWRETLGGGHAEMEGRTPIKAFQQGEYGAAAMSLRELVSQFAAKPVAFGDFISSAPMWLGKYLDEMDAHGVHGDAVYAADKAVRRAHGSSAITSRSSVARARALGPFTKFFTFFNDLLNRQVETIWKAGEAIGKAKEGDRAEALKDGKDVVWRIIAYAVVPTVIEELVTPQLSDSHESFLVKAAKAVLFTGSASWVFARDIVNAMLNNRDPSAGLLSTVLKAPVDEVRDMSSVRLKPGTVIKHSTQLAGILAGIMPAQVGRSSAFLVSKEHPKGPWGWMVGLRYGTLDKHSPTFEKWLKEL